MDWSKTIKALGVGVDVDMKKVVIFVYADGIVILAENEQDLPMLLDIIYRWSQEWQMMVNVKNKLKLFISVKVQVFQSQKLHSNMENNRSR